MKLKSKIGLIFCMVVIFSVISACFFAGCGDDGNYTINTPGGATGPTGGTGATGTTGITGITGNTGPDAGTESLAVYLWRDTAQTVPLNTPFTVNLERVLSNPGSISLVAQDNSSTPGVVQFDNLAPGTYDVSVYPMGYLPIVEKNVVLENSSTKALVELNFVLPDTDRVLYGATTSIWGSNQLNVTTTTTTTTTSTPDTPDYFKSALYAISSETGETTIINPDTGIEILAMDIDPNNNFYAVGAEYYGGGGTKGFDPYFYYVLMDTMALYKIDYITGIPEKVVDLDYSPPCLISDISFDPDGTLYAFVNIDGSNNDNLATVNMDTGAVTLLTRPDTPPMYDENDYCSHSIGFGGNNLYYLFGLGNAGWVAPNSAFYQWQNPGTTPALSEINTYSPASFFSGMDYYNGNLYAVVYDAWSDMPFLISINPADGNPTVIGNIYDGMEPLNIQALTTP